MAEQRPNLSDIRLSASNLRPPSPRPLSSSAELRDPHLWAESPGNSFPEVKVPDESKRSLLSRCKGNSSAEGCFGCSTWPRAVAFILTLALLVAACIVIPIVLTNFLSKPTTTDTSTTTETTSTASTTTTETTSTVSTTTSATTVTSTTSTSTTTSACGVSCVKATIPTSSRLAYYNFDSNINDVTGAYPASSASAVTYVTGYTRSAISLNAVSYQRLMTSPMNLYNTSFTIQLWFYLTGLPTQDNAFFGQQSVSSVQGQCLFVMSRLGRLYMGFFNDDTMGSTLLQNFTWYHAAFIYDNDKRQRSIYLNGVLEAQSVVGVGPYLGTSGSMTIGNAKVDGTVGTPYFTGYIDELIVYTRARGSCELSNDATLAAYLTLDNTINDSGPDTLTVTQSGTLFTTGYTNQAVYLTGGSSFLQIQQLVSLGRSNYPYSIALWVNPVFKGVLIHLSTSASGLGWCTPLMTFNAAGALLAQVYYSSTVNTVTGPSILYNTWTHITHTYSPSNGQRLYINGALYTSLASSTIYTASGSPEYLTVGNMLSGGACYNPGYTTSAFQGAVDDLRVYSRELSSIDACLLAQS